MLSLVSLESSLEMTSAMEKAFKQGFSSVVSRPLFDLKNNHFQYDCDLTADEYLE